MRYLVGFLILCAVGSTVLLVGCDTFCAAAGCTDGVQIEFVPEIEVAYDVDLVLDGEAEAFTCVREYDELSEDWVWRPQPSFGVDCDGDGFRRTLGFGNSAVPESVEITVNAQDGSWSGSLTTRPTYETVQPNGSDCPPTCRFARVTIANEVDALEVQP